MNRARWFLVAVIAGELAVGGYLVARRAAVPAPPVADLSDVDPVTAAELRALAGDCRTAAGCARLGEVYLAAGFFPEAEACLGRATALEPASADFRFQHAFALERLGEADEAIAAYEAAAERGHPRAADCKYHVGRNHLRLGRTGPAAEAFVRAGNLPAARYELALLDARAGRSAEADAAAAALADEFPDAYPPASLRCRLALARGDRAAFERHADAFARRPRPLPTPLDAEVTWIFGLADGLGRARLFRDAGREFDAGRLPAAETKLRDVLHARWDPEVADRLGQVTFLLGMREESRRVLAEAVDRGGPGFELLWRLAQAEEAVGNDARALELLERAARVASGPRATGVWEDLAERYRRAGKGEQAGPLAARAHLADGLAALDAGRPADAAAALDRAVKEDPSLAHAWFALGEARRLAGQRDEARKAYDRCLTLDPDHGRAARALRLLGK